MTKKTKIQATLEVNKGYDCVGCLYYDESYSFGGTQCKRFCDLFQKNLEKTQAKDDGSETVFRLAECLAAEIDLKGV